MSKLALAIFAACVCAVYGGGAVLPYAYSHPAVVAAAPAVVEAAPAVVEAAPAVVAAAPAVSYAAPAVVPAAVPAVTYTAPVAVVDPTHFSYGYLQPFGNGHVEVARNGPVESHSYSFNSGNVFP